MMDQVPPKNTLLNQAELAIENNQMQRARLMFAGDRLVPVGLTIAVVSDPRLRTNRIKYLTPHWKSIIENKIPVSPITLKRIADSADTIISRQPEIDRTDAERSALDALYKSQIEETKTALVKRGVREQRALIYAACICGGYSTAEVIERYSTEENKITQAQITVYLSECRLAFSNKEHLSYV